MRTSDRVSNVMRECRAVEAATGIRITGHYLPWSENEEEDSGAIHEAKGIYNNRVRAAQERYAELTAPAKAEYDESFAAALEDLLSAFKEERGLQ